MANVRVASLSVDNSQAKAAMAETGAGMRKVGDAAASVGQTTEKETARLRTYGREWQGVEKRMAGSAESLKKFEAMQGFAARAVEAGRLTQEQASEAVEKYRLKLVAGAAAAERAAKAQEAAAQASARAAMEQARAVDSLSQQMDSGYAAQVRYAQKQQEVIDLHLAGALNGRQFAAAMKFVAESYDPAIVAAKKEEDALRSLIGGLDRTWGASDKLAERQGMLDKAMREGVNGVRLSREEHERFSKVLRDQHEIATRSASSTKLAAHESLNLGYQLQDFVVQVGSGQGVLTPLLQQAPQAVGAVGGLDRAMALLTSRTALTAMGVGALGLAFGVVMGRAVTIQGELRQFNALLKATGDQAGMTAEQMRSVADSMMGGGASRDDASTVVKNIVQTRKRVSAELAKDIGSLSVDMGVVFGGTTDAGKRLTDWLTTGVKGLRDMAAETGALSLAQYEAARAAMEHGEQEKGLSIVIGALKDRFSGLHRDSLSPAGQALEDLSLAYNDLVNAAAEHPVTITVEVVGADLLKSISAFIKDPMNFQFPTFSRDTEFPTPFGIGNRLKKPNPTLSEGAITGNTPWEPPAPAGTPIPGRKPTAIDGVPLTEAIAISDAAAANDKLLAAMQKVGAERVIATARLQAESAAFNAGKSDKAAELEGLEAARMARAQLVVAVNDSIRAAAAEVQGNDLLAQAYGVSGAAVREAAIQQKAIAEAARGTIEPYDAIVTRLRLVDDATRKLQAAQFDATLKQQTEDATRLAAAWTKGADAAHEATLANEALAEARKRGLDPTRDAAEIQGIGQGVLARDIAQRSQQFAQMATEQRRAVDLANAEYGMLGQSNAERAKAVAQIQAANDLRDKGADLTDAGTQAYIRQAGELAKVNSILQESAQTAANITQPITSGLEDVIVGAKGAGDAVKALGDDLKRLAARQLVTKPFETEVSGFLTKLMSGGVTVSNDNRPTPANDPGVLDRIVTQVRGGLGSSADNAMWVRMSAGAAALAPGQSAWDKVASLAQPMPVAIKDAGELNTLVEQIGAKYGIDAALIKGIIQQESSWNPNAVNSRSGAAGLMQIMPANFKAYGVTNPFDPAQNIDAGTRILKEMLVRSSGDTAKALSLFSGHIKTSGAAYVSAVNGSADGYRRADAGLRLVADNTRGVAAAQEQQLQAQLDAAAAQNVATGSAQALSASQESLIASVLGTSDAATTTTASINVLARPMDRLKQGAISAADAQNTAAASATGFAGTVANAASGLWSWVSSMLSSSPSAGGANASSGATGVVATGGNLLSSAKDIGSLVSAGKNVYTAFTGGSAASAANAANWFATSSAGNSLGLSTAIDFGSGAPAVFGAQGAVAIPTEAGASLIGTAGQMGAGLPFGAIGGIGGSMIGTATNSKAIGGLSGAALGAGAAGLYGSIFGMGAVGGPVGIAVAAVVAGVMAMLGTQKKSVGPTGQATIFGDVGGNTRFVNAAADNGGDSGPVEQAAKAAVAAINGVYKGYGGSMTAGFGNNPGLISQGGKFEATFGDGKSIGKYDTLDEASTEFAKAVLSKASTDIAPDVQTALKNTTAKTLTDLATDLDFAGSFKKTAAALQGDFGFDDAATKTAKENADALAKSFTDWSEKTKALGLDTDLATKAAQSYANALVYGRDATKDLTAGEQQVRALQLQWTEMPRVFEAAGFAADKAAQMAKDGYEHALGVISQQAVAGWQRDSHDARGVGAVDTATDLVKKFNAAVRDAAALGQDDTLIRNTFNNRLSALFGGLSKDARDAVIHELSGPGVVLEGTTAAMTQAILGVAQASDVAATALEQLTAQQDLQDRNRSYRGVGEINDIQALVKQYMDDRKTGMTGLADDTFDRGLRDTLKKKSASEQYASLTDLSGAGVTLGGATVELTQAMIAVAQDVLAETRRLEIADLESRNRAADVTLGKLSQAAYDQQELEIKQQRELKAVTDPVVRAKLLEVQANETLAASYTRLQAQTNALRSGRDAVEQAIDPAWRADAGSRLAGAGITNAAEIASLRPTFAAIADAAKTGSASAGQMRDGLAALNTGLTAGRLTVEQYGQAVGVLTSIWQDSKQAADKLAAAQAANGDLLARGLTALGRTRDAALMNFDLRATADRKSLADTGGNVGLFDAVSRLERASLTATTARDDYLEALSRQESALQDSVTADRTLYDAITGLAQSMRDLSKSLLIDGSVSTLNPGDRMAEAERQLNAAAAIANDASKPVEDRVAAGQKIDGLTKAVLSAAEENFGGKASTAYDAKFHSVLALVDGLGASIPTQLSVSQNTLKAQEAQLTEIKKLRDQANRLGERQLGSISSLEAQMTTAFAALQSEQASYAAQSVGYLAQIAGSTAAAAAQSAAAQAGGVPTGSSGGINTTTSNYNGLVSSAPTGLGGLQSLLTANAILQDNIATSARTGQDRSADIRSGKEQVAALLGGLPSPSAVDDEQRPWLRQVVSFLTQSGFDGLPKYATGGYLPAGQAGIAGETGRPELIFGPAYVANPDVTAAMMGRGPSNDRWSAPNVTALPAPRVPTSGGGDGGTSAAIDRLSNKIDKLIAALERSGAVSGEQRALIAADLVAELKKLRAAQDELPNRVAGAIGK